MQSRFIKCAAKWSLCCIYAAACSCIIIFSYKSYLKLFWSTNMIYFNNVFGFLCIFNRLEKIGNLTIVCCKYAAICSKPRIFKRSTIFFLFHHAKIPPSPIFMLFKICSSILLISPITPKEEFWLFLADFSGSVAISILTYKWPI